MYRMCLIESDGEQIMDVCGEALETRLIAQESMNIDQQQGPALAVLCRV